MPSKAPWSKHHLLGSTSNWVAMQTREAPARSHPMRFGELGLKTLRRCPAGWLDGVLLSCFFDDHGQSEISCFGVLAV